jgi:branched-chain amino acid transport system ATP-binding protein
MSTPAERLDLGLARTLQRTEVFPDMTVLEHVLLGARVRQNYGGPWRTVFSTPKARREAKASGQRGEEILSAVGLGWARDLASRELSSGDQRLLMVAMACSSSPRVLLLDEPSAGMSHAYVDRLRNLIGKLRDDGVTLLLVEHNLRLVGEVADGVTVLSAGQVIAEGTPSEVASDPVVVGTYLGSSRM